MDVNIENWIEQEATNCAVTRGVEERVKYFKKVYSLLHSQHQKELEEKDREIERLKKALVLELNSPPD